MSLLAQEGLVGVLGALFGFGYLALLIYLIIRFIEVADDVRAIRRSVQDGAGSSLSGGGVDVASLREAAELHERGILNEAEFARVKASIVGGSTSGSDTATSAAATLSHGPPIAIVRLLEPGPDPDAVARVLVEKAGFMPSGARGAVEHPPQIVLHTPDAERAAALVRAIEAGGGSAEVRDA